MSQATPLSESFFNSYSFDQEIDGKTPVVSSLQMGWEDILVEEYEYEPTSEHATTAPMQVPALSEHWLILPLGSSIKLSQRSDDCLHESLFQSGDSLLVPAGSATCWRCEGSPIPQRELYIRLLPDRIEQVVEAAGVDISQTLANRLVKQDLKLQNIAMLLLAELRSGGEMGRLYVDALTQALAIHLLRHYAESTSTNISSSKRLTLARLQPAIDYIHTSLNQELSLSELAAVVNVSPNHFASLFKRTIGISPHQYVIQQRVERAKVMLMKTDLAIADIALEVGFSSQSHLTQHFKRITGTTPKQIR